MVLTEDEYRALLKVAPRVDWRFHLALVLAHETGHRIGAIRQLWWCDIDFEGGTIRWRAEHDKSGHELLFGRSIRWWTTRSRCCVKRAMRGSA